MADPKQLKILENGVVEWNKWRREHRDVRPNLIEAHLGKMNLTKIDLSDADLMNVDLVDADLVDADLSDADLSWAKLSGVKLMDACLVGADLTEADLIGADLRATNLSRANLRLANLSGADLRGAILSWTILLGTVLSRAMTNHARFSGAWLAATTFAENDLRETTGLETVQHLGPSHISICTIYESKGMIPDKFLRGAGVPEGLIANIPSIIGATQPIQYKSNFIAYSSSDEEFARCLNSRMLDEKLRVWLGAEEIRGGQKFIQRTDRTNHLNDRLLLVLSEHSLRSEWVKNEICEARRVEAHDVSQKLFPIRLVSIERIRSWQCFDADTGEDLAAAVREYHILDFSNWKDHDAFEAAFAELLCDLRAGA